MDSSRPEETPQADFSWEFSNLPLRVLENLFFRLGLVYACDLALTSKDTYAVFESFNFRRVQRLSQQFQKSNLLSRPTKTSEANHYLTTLRNGVLAVVKQSIASEIATLTVCLLTETESTANISWPLQHNIDNLLLSGDSSLVSVRVRGDGAQRIVYVFKYTGDTLSLLKSLNIGCNAEYFYEYIIDGPDERFAGNDLIWGLVERAWANPNNDWPYFKIVRYFRCTEACMLAHSATRRCNREHHVASYPVDGAHLERRELEMDPTILRRGLVMATSDNRICHVVDFETGALVPIDVAGQRVSDRYESTPAHDCEFSDTTDGDALLLHLTLRRPNLRNPLWTTTVRFNGHGAEAQSFGFELSSDGRLLACHVEGEHGFESLPAVVRISDGATLHSHHANQTQYGPCIRQLISPDGSLIVRVGRSISADDKYEIILYDSCSGQVCGSLLCECSRETDVEFDGRFVFFLVDDMGFFVDLDQAILLRPN